MHARPEGVGAGAKALVETKDRPSPGPRGSDRSARGASGALAGSSGANLEDVVVEDLGRGVALLADLAVARKGRATILGAPPAYVPAGRAAILLSSWVRRSAWSTRCVRARREGLVYSVVGATLSRRRHGRVALRAPLARPPRRWSPVTARSSTPTDAYRVPGEEAGATCSMFARDAGLADQSGLLETP